jgi:hypothetical protein
MNLPALCHFLEGIVSANLGDVDQHWFRELALCFIAEAGESDRDIPTGADARS